jgi:hypothetical protein
VMVSPFLQGFKTRQLYTQATVRPVSKSPVFSIRTVKALNFLHSDGSLRGHASE